MMQELIQHLLASGLFTGYAFTDWRDDATAPFSLTVGYTAGSAPFAGNIFLVRIQGGRQDAHIGAIGVDIYLHSKANATNSDREALLATAAQLDRYLTTETVFANVQHIEMPTSSAGPYKDGQNRYFTAHRITIRRSGV